MHVCMCIYILVILFSNDIKLLKIYNKDTYSYKLFLFLVNTHQKLLLVFILQVHLNKFEQHEKGQYFLSLISESETHILYRFVTQSEIFQ